MGTYRIRNKSFLHQQHWLQTQPYKSYSVADPELPDAKLGGFSDSFPDPIFRKVDDFVPNMKIFKKCRPTEELDQSSLHPVLEHTRLHASQAGTLAKS